MLTVNTLKGSFGAEIRDVDLARDNDPATFKRIVDLAHTHRVLIIRGQRLSESEYAAFGRQWGDPIVFFRESHRNKAFPELIEIHNATSTPADLRDYALHWHTDSSYQKEPASVTLLNAIEAPQVGGETQFVDMSAAYDALPEETRTRIDALQVKHRVGAGKRHEGEKKLSDANLQYSEEELRQLDPPVHPLVMRHPITGRRALYAVAGSAYGIVGMDDEKGEALLTELKRHATQECFRLEVKANAGDILIWDNFATMHTATPLEYSDEEGKRRRLMRISVTGLPPVCRQ